MTTTQGVPVEKFLHSLEAVAGGPILRERDGRHDGADLPAEWPDDVTREPRLGVEGAEELLDIDEVGLHLHHQQNACRMPGEHIDPAALAVPVVAHLDPDQPAPALEPPLHGRRDGRVGRIQQAVQFGPVPQDADLGPGTQGGEHLLDGAEFQATRTATLQCRDGSPANPRPRGEGRLRQPLTDPQRPDQPAEPLHVHVTDHAGLGLTHRLRAAYQMLGQNGRAMPEGDTIFRTAEVLRAALVGRRITSARAQPRPGLRRVPDLSVLVGTTVTLVESRGKHLLIGFGNGLTLRSHLRMSGSWHRYRPGEPWRRPVRQASAILETAESVAVAFNTPVVELLTDAALRRSMPLRELGPDLLGGQFDEPEAMHRLRMRDGEELGNALLDQRAVAGIGNVYKSEVAFLEGLDPWAPVGTLADAELAGTLRTARRLLRANTRGGARVTTGSGARGEGLWVYGRGGRPCRRCGTPIRQGRQGELARLTFWCPRCQPGRRDSKIAPPGAQ